MNYDDIIRRNLESGNRSSIGVCDDSNLPTINSGVSALPFIRVPECNCMFWDNPSVDVTSRASLDSVSAWGD